MKRRLKSAAVCLSICCVLVVLLAMSLERFLIFPAPQYPQGNWICDAPDFEEVWLTASDGTKLHGWYFWHSDPQATVLFCHGNGSCVANLGSFAQRLRDRHRVNLFVFDYRGYGRSEGTPNEQGVCLDAASARQWLAKRAGVASESLVLMGRSLGGAVAVHLASQQPCRGLVLHSTFSSMTDVGARHYPWLPVRWCLRNRFPSIEKLGRCVCPLLQLHGDVDEVVPMDLGRKLFDVAVMEQKKFVVLNGVGHNDAIDLRCEQEIESFLSTLAVERLSE